MIITVTTLGVAVIVCVAGILELDEFDQEENVLIVVDGGDVEGARVTVGPCTVSVLVLSSMTVVGFADAGGGGGGGGGVVEEEPPSTLTMA